MNKIIFFLAAIFLPFVMTAAETAGKFPGANGSAEMTVVFKKTDAKNQVIFQFHSAKGDLFNLRTVKNRLQAAFYDRSEKKWYRSSGNRPMPVEKACKVGVRWNIPGKIDLTLDGKEAGGVVVDVQPDFDKKGLLSVGANQVGGDKFAGEIRELKFSSARPADIQKKAASPAKPADVRKKTSVRAEYVFELTIDEQLKDLSDNGYHPLNTPVESKFAKGELDAVRFSADGDGIQLPPAAFPGASGAVEIVANLERSDAGKNPSYLLQLYSVKGDMFKIYYHKNRLFASYYSRSEKKWHTTSPGLTLPSGKFVKITADWDLPGVITLSVDGRKSGKIQFSGKAAFTSDAKLFIGSNHLKKEFFKGLIHSVKFLDYRQDSGKTIKKSAAKKSIELVNHRLGGITLGFDKKTLTLQSMLCGNVEYLSPKNNIAPWTMRIYDVNDKRFLDIDPAGASETSFKLSRNSVTFIWHGIALPDGSKFDAEAVVSAAGKDKLNWQFTSGTLPDRYRADTVVYPRLPCRPTAKDPHDMYLCYPKYYGINIPDAFNLKTGRERSFGSTYPGGAHYQFIYLYGKNVPGIFLHTPDKNGNYKEFIFQALPKQKTLLVQLFQNPAQRAVSRRFEPQYPVHTAIIPGDWYDAAKLYRTWAVEQPWSAKGTLDKRSDLPEWMFNTHIAARPSCQTPEMTDVKGGASRVKLNISNFRIIQGELNCGALAVWYSYYYADPGTRYRWRGASARFNGRPEMKLIPGVDKAVKELKAGNMYSIGFLNTRIYDESPDPDHADTKAVEPLVMRNQDGSFQRYGNLPFDVCRIARPWQERLLKIIKHRTEVNGFAGMYLDSFGRGQYHCWAENHGHLPGSATASVAGQREMAKLIKTEMNKIVPGFVISSEANIEQFVDLIDFKLHHENIYEHAVPVWTKIYHDRQFVYGRNANPARIQATACFHIGALLGRIFIGNSDEGLRKNYLSQEVAAYYRQLIAMRKYFYSQIGVGEMLRPPRVTGNIPDVVENVSKKKFAYPAVTASAWRSSSGVPCAFFTNASAQNVKFSFTLDKNEFTSAPVNWVLTDNAGNVRKVPFDGRYSFELPPLSAAALEFR